MGKYKVRVEKNGYVPFKQSFYLQREQQLFAKLTKKVLPRFRPRIEQHGENPNSQQTALVIGNSEYDYSPLRNPVNDAKGMTEVLVKLGFYVIQATNLTHQEMKEVLQAFEKRLSGTPESVAFFYFSGHGAQVNGENFLLPINNNDIQEEKDLKQQAFLAQDILTTMQTVNNGMNILVLDACRNNPYDSSYKDKGLAHGLVKMIPPRGAIIAFAGAAGCQTSLYTSHLIRALENAKHKRIEDVFMEARNSVLEESGEQQEPWYQSSLRKPFCFGGCR